MKTTKYGLVALVFVYLVAPSAVRAGAFTNGNLESNTCTFNGSGFAEPSTGSTCITGWTVGDGTMDPGMGSVDLIATYWQNPPGSYSVDLDGSHPGSIYQTFDTVSGATYTVTFDLSGNPDGGDGTKYLQVTADGSTVDYTYTVGPSNSKSNMLYELETFTFMASGPSTTLTFASEDASTSPYGPVIGDVSLSPEPSTWSLLITGLLALFIGARRKRRMQSAQSLSAQHPSPPANT